MDKKNIGKKLRTENLVIKLADSLLRERNGGGSKKHMRKIFCMTTQHPNSPEHRDEREWE